MSDDSVIRKIRALLAKARGSENEHEALAFGAKAAELLQQHNLAAEDVAVKEFVEKVETRYVIHVDINQWRTAIYQALAELYFCRVFSQKKVQDGKIRPAIGIVGKPHNAEIVVEMAEYLLKTTQRLAKGFSSYRRDILQFEKGCGNRIAQRVYEMVKKSKTVALPSGGNLPALYASESKLLDAEFARIGVRTVAARSLSYREAAHAGARAANNVHLGGQIRSGPAGTALR